MEKKGFVIKSFPEFEGLGLHVDTFIDYLKSLPNSNGWVHFAIHDSKKGSVHPKSMTPQLGATPKEFSFWLWESSKPGARTIDFKTWLEARRSEEKG